MSKFGNALQKEKKLSHLEDMKNCLEYDTQGPHNPWYIRKFANFLFFWRKWYIGPQYHMVSMKDVRIPAKAKPSFPKKNYLYTNSTGSCL